MITDKEYQSLLRFAKAYLSKKPHLQADDLVNDVLIEIIESGKPFNKLDAERKIKSHPDVRAKTLQKRGHDFRSWETEKICKDCKELLPVGMFYIHDLPTTRVLGSYCKECHNKRATEWQRSTVGKLSNKERQKRYREKHTLKSKQLQAEYQKRNKEKRNEQARKRRAAKKEGIIIWGNY
jgi:hypothetical protein